MKKWFLAFIIAIGGVTEGVTLKTPTLEGKTFLQRLAAAKNGDYIVTEANQVITLLAVRSLTPQSVILEEISAPSEKVSPSSWAEWIRDKAPGHTSWSMMEIDLKTAQVIECYSFSRSSWVQIGPNESLIATLLHLQLHPVPPQDQKKIGPPPPSGEADHRKIWKPPFIFEGKKRENPQFEVVHTTWPKDQSELSNQEVTLYFDREKAFPFPIWIQVDTAHATASIHTLDAGTHLPIIHRHFPRRVPEFIGMPQKTSKGLLLTLKSPKYYQQFELFAIDITTKEKQVHPISHHLNQSEGECLKLEVSKEELEQVLKPNHRYTWLLVPNGHSESYTETRKPFVWHP